jgi:hypothetical protein
LAAARRRSISAILADMVAALPLRSSCAFALPADVHAAKQKMLPELA